MIEKIAENMYELSCDKCCRETGVPFDDFYEAVDYKRDHGWVSRKNKFGEWEEICDLCIEKERRAEVASSETPTDAPPDIESILKAMNS